WYPVDCWQKIDSTWYYFDESGYMLSDQWQDGYYLDANGAYSYIGLGMWHKDSNGWYYKDNYGWSPKDCWQKINGEWYYFGNDSYWDEQHQ
nr:hypothetical protein [Eubacterium sp.]